MIIQLQGSTEVWYHESPYCRGSGVQGFGSTGVQEYQMFNSNIIIYQVPIKAIIMNKQCNTGVRCDSI